MIKANTRKERKKENYVRELKSYKKKVAERNEERENIVDEGPDNPLEFEALEAVNAMED